MWQQIKRATLDTVTHLQSLCSITLPHTKLWWSCVLWLYLYRAVKEAVELDKASSGVWAGRCRLCILVDTSWLTEEWISIAENNQTSQESAHEKSSKHAGDEDVHVDHLVGLACLDIPNTYKTVRYWLTPWLKESKRSVKHPSPLNSKIVHVCVWTQSCMSFCFHTSLPYKVVSQPQPKFINTDTFLFI